MSGGEGQDEGPETVEAMRAAVAKLSKAKAAAMPRQAPEPVEAHRASG